MNADIKAGQVQLDNKAQRQETDQYEESDPRTPPIGNKRSSEREEVMDSLDLVGNSNPGAQAKIGSQSAFEWDIFY